MTTEQAMRFNRKAATDFNDSHIARVERLFWLASHNTHRNHELEDFFEDLMDSLEMPRTLPNVPFDDCTRVSDVIDNLHSYDVQGFICEFYVAEPRNIRFEDKRPVAWTQGGAYRIGYAYGETPAQMLERAIAEADQIFRQMVDEYRVKNPEQADT